MIEDFIYAGYKFKATKLEEDYLVTMYKENQRVDKFIVPSLEEIFFFIDKFLNKFYSHPLRNTTRSYRSR